MKDFHLYRTLMHKVYTHLKQDFKKRFIKKISFPSFQVILCVSSGILFFLTIYLATYNNSLRQKIELQKTYSLPISSPVVAPYPNFASIMGPNSSFKLSSQLQLTTAEAMIVMDDESKVPLYEKNAHLRFSMASTTKIMSALVAIEYYKPQDILPVKDEGVEGSVVGFVDGEKLTFLNILYGMLLPSGNDAALTVARNYPGGEDAFIARMNEKAREYHLVNTHFSDPVGLADDGDYTTASDLALLCSIAMKNPLFAQIVGTKEKTITDVTQKNIYELKNLNILLGFEGVDGVKTGYTDEAEEVLTTTLVANGHRFILVVMKSKDRFYDTEQLLGLIHNGVVYQRF